MWGNGKLISYFTLLDVDDRGADQCIYCRVEYELKTFAEKLYIKGASGALLKE